MHSERQLPSLKTIVVTGFGALVLLKLTIGGSTSLVIGSMQMVLIALSAMAGFTLGWLFSPQARRFRLITAAIVVGLGVLLGVGDAGAAGIGMTSIISTIAFFAALFYWIGGLVRGFAKPPTTFGSAEWATLLYLEEHGVVGDTGIRLGRFGDHETASRCTMPATGTC